MIMSERIKVAQDKKNSKKAFTLVELVIVIAVLAVLAAIAIPVITTSINSTKISVMESDAATVEMLLKEAINCSKVQLNTLYNNQRVVNASVKDVLIQNHIDDSVMEVKKIGDLQYAIYWDSMQQGTSLHSGTSITKYNVDTKIAALDPE